MATRSAIGYATPSGRIRAAYCHWDGFPERQLPILTTHFNSEPAVRLLIKPGSMSCLWTTSTWGDTVRSPQPLYHKERGDGIPPHLCQSLSAALSFWMHQGCEHLYVFWPERGWQHYSLD